MNLDLYGILSTARIQSFTNANEREGLLNPNFNTKLTIPSDCFPNPKIIFAVVFWVALWLKPQSNSIEVFFWKESINKIYLSIKKFVVSYNLLLLSKGLRLRRYSWFNLFLYAVCLRSELCHEPSRHYITSVDLNHTVYCERERATVFITFLTVLLVTKTFFWFAPMVIAVV